MTVLLFGGFGTATDWPNLPVVVTVKSAGGTTTATATIQVTQPPPPVLATYTAADGVNAYTDKNLVAYTVEK